ncbi:Transcription factor iws1 [Nowakowskiella sp. JEL0407]|nr:Transcription factor iws1 [Nowakowskiella sp. JEL0407]
MASTNELHRQIFGEDDDDDDNLDSDLDAPENDDDDGDEAIFGLLNSSTATTNDTSSNLNIKKRVSAKDAGFSEYRPSKKASKKDTGEKNEVEDERTVKRKEIESQIDAISKKSIKRRKRGDEEDESTQLDDSIVDLINKMELAAQKDIEANDNKQFSGAKMKLLPLVENEFKKQHWDAMLDNGILKTIKGWLEPLPDMSLPALDIQRVMMKTLGHLPVERYSLEASGIGKVVKFYTIRKGVNPEVKRKAQDLVDKWTRIITKRTDQVHNRVYEQVEIDQKLLRSYVISS